MVCFPMNTKINYRFSDGERGIEKNMVNGGVMRIGERQFLESWTCVHVINRTDCEKHTAKVP